MKRVAFVFAVLTFAIAAFFLNRYAGESAGAPDPRRDQKTNIVTRYMGFRTDGSVTYLDLSKTPPQKVTIVTGGNDYLFTDSQGDSANLTSSTPLNVNTETSLPAMDYQLSFGIDKNGHPLWEYDGHYKAVPTASPNSPTQLVGGTMSIVEKLTIKSGTAATPLPLPVSSPGP